jgi:hypothetical protein
VTAVSDTAEAAVVEALTARPSRRLPVVRSGPWFAELLGAVAGYELYDVVQARTSGDADTANRYGRAIAHAEQVTHLDPERAFNRLATDHAWLGIVSGYWYGLAHVTVTAAVLIFLWNRRRPDYARMRTALIVMSLIGLLVFWLLPVAPPRFATPGLTDTLAVHDILGAAHVHKGLVDLYAAMPSLHMAWATWCAIAIVATTPRERWRRHLAWLYPTAMAVDVLMTANHYLADIAAGAVLSGVCCAAFLVRRRS